MVGALDRLVGDAEDALPEKDLGQRWPRREVEVGEERLAVLQQVILRGGAAPSPLRIRSEDVHTRRASGTESDPPACRYSASVNPALRPADFWTSTLAPRETHRRRQAWGH